MIAPSPTERYADHIETLAAFACAVAAGEKIPAEVLDRGRWILADCVGCIVAGNRVAEVQALANIDSSRAGPGGAGIIGTRTKTRREAAATINGAAGTWLDLDEGNIHTKGHAGIQVVPAALAEAECSGHSGSALLRALIAGYEAGCRVYGATAARLAVHPHGTYGPLAAAVALGCLRGIGPEKMARVISIAAGLGVPASRQTLNDGATIRNAFTAASARNAFHALDLAEAGFTGERNPLTSVFGNILGESFDAARCVAGLGREWRILRNYFKLHPSARYAHSATDLIDEIFPPSAAAPPIQKIERIEMDTYFMAWTMRDANVSSAFGTRFSIPFVIAARLLGADNDITDDGRAAFARADIHHLASRVAVREIPEFSRAYPERQPSVLRIIMTDGQVFTARAEMMRGEAERPHPRAAMRRKFLSLTSPSWGARAVVALESLLAIDTMADVGTMIASWRSD